MWSHHDPQWVMLPLRELREHKWVFVRSVKNSEMANGWAAYALYPKHPMMALANGAMAVAIVLGVILFWHPGRRG
jgi:hypothetical protein